MKVFINESILTPDKIWEPTSKEEFNSNIQELLHSLGCFNFFNECEIFFSSTGISKLIEDLKFVDECNEYSLFDEISQLRQAIVDLDAIDWSQSKIHKDDYNYIVQLDGGFTPYNSTGTSLAEATEYRHDNNKTVILNFLSSQFNSYNYVKINRANINPPGDMNLYSIESFCQKNEVISCYLKNRDVIEYNHNTKHGENHTVVKTIDGKIISPLECTQAEARQYVKLAIGDRKGKDLYSYDAGRDKFIRFKYENTENPKTYHAFYPHNQDIPKEVKGFLKMNKESFKAESEA